MTSEEKTKVIGCDFFLIHKFMLRDLALSGGELLVFAFLYSFFKSHGSYYGSREYIAESTGLTTRSVTTAIKSLKEKELIEKGESEDGGTIYTLHCKCEKRVKNFPSGGEKISLNEGKNFTKGEKNFPSTKEKISPNNKEYNKDYNKVDNKADKRTTREGRARENTKKEFFKEEGQEGEHTDRESRGNSGERKIGYQRAGGVGRGAYKYHSKLGQFLEKEVEERMARLYGDASILYREELEQMLEEK